MMNYNRMPILALLFVVLPLVFTSVVQAQLSDKQLKELAKTFKKINKEVQTNAKAYDALKEATETIGHRLTGTQNGKKAEEYAANFFRKAGFTDVKFMPFEVTAWMRDSVYLGMKELGSAAPEYNVDAVALAHTPVQADVTAEVVWVGNGLRRDFDNVKTRIKGKIALMNLGIDPPDTSQRNLHRSEKTALAIEYGAVGAIVINNNKGGKLLTGTCSVTGDLVSIPVVCITYEEGQNFKNAMAQSTKFEAHIKMKNRSDKIKARNVIATLPGTDPDPKIAKEKVVIGGHLDSWDLSVCAIDNGIGSFTVLDVARTFKALDLKPRRTIEFIMFMGEEIGLVGSRAYIEEATKKKQLDNIKYMINLDMAGNPVGFNVMGRDEIEPLIKQIGAQINKIDTIFKNKVVNGVGLHSDHQPFMMEGIPTMNPVSNLEGHIYSCYHSNCDDFELVNKTHMHNGVRFTAMMLYGISMADAIPAPRLSFEQTRDFFIKHKLKDEMIIAKEWKWGN